MTETELDETDQGLLAEMRDDEAEAVADGGRLRRKAYERELHKLQVQLSHLQTWVREGRRHPPPAQELLPTRPGRQQRFAAQLSRSVKSEMSMQLQSCRMQ